MAGETALLTYNILEHFLFLLIMSVCAGGHFGQFGSTQTSHCQGWTKIAKWGQIIEHVLYIRLWCALESAKFHWFNNAIDANIYSMLG